MNQNPYYTGLYIGILNNYIMFSYQQLLKVKTSLLNSNVNTKIPFYIEKIF